MGGSDDAGAGREVVGAGLCSGPGGTLAGAVLNAVHPEVNIIAEHMNSNRRCIIDPPAFATATRVDRPSGEWRARSHRRRCYTMDQRSDCGRSRAGTTAVIDGG
jgi:hypothetical protein